MNTFRTTWNTMTETRKFWLVTSSIYIALFLYEWLFLSNIEFDITFGLTDEKLNLGWLLFYSQIIYMFASSFELRDGGFHFRSVKIDQRGVKIIAGGYPLQNLDPGPYHAPLVFVSVELVPRTEIQYEFPTDLPDFIPDFDANGKMKKPSYRITHSLKDMENPDDDASDYTNNDVDDSLQTRLTSDCSWFVRFRILDAKKFLGRVGTKADGIRQLDDIGTSELKAQLQRRTPSRTYKDWSKIEGKLLNKIVTHVEHWGVEITQSGIKMVDMPHAVNTALSRVVESQLNKKARIQEGEGEGKYNSLVGKGTADARKLLMLGESKGYSAIVTALGLDESDPELRKIILTSQVARDAITKANINLVHTGGSMMSELTGAVSTVKQVIDLSKQSGGDIK